MTTGLVTHADCLLHDTGAGHPERPARLRAVLERLELAGTLSELEALEAPQVAEEALLRVHPAAHLRHVEAVCAAGPAYVDGSDTAVAPASARAARLAAGAAVAAVERVWDGRWSSAFVAVRPPGHHAEEATAMGFCLYNNAAVAARAAQALGARRVAILDWDVHHGNGTQHLFDADPSVYYASLHQWPLYPGTGAAEERGRGDGAGTTRNCPMAPGTGDAAWLAALEGVVLPEMDAFAPDLVLISAGFDAHARDPLGGCELSAGGYAAMTRLVAALAAERCGGRVVSVLEGGYDLEALAESANAHVAALVDVGP
jgi:acetoin utilization deacetylase AcuC-like enzyme